MNTTVSPHRAQLCRLILRKRTFLLRMPSTGLLVRSSYDFYSSALSVGTIVGVAGLDWVEIGQITAEVFCHTSQKFVYYISPINRLTQNSTVGRVNVPADNISCVFVIVGDNDELSR